MKEHLRRKDWNGFLAECLRKGVKPMQAAKEAKNFLSTSDWINLFETMLQHKDAMLTRWSFLQKMVKAFYNLEQNEGAGPHSRTEDGPCFCDHAMS